MYQLLKNKTLAFVAYVAGRVVPMYRRSSIMWSSKYMSWLGRTFLRTKLFTEEEFQAARKARQSTEHMGLGPVPEYMRNEFYYAPVDRTIRPSPEHLNASILLSVFRNKCDKKIAGRVFWISLGLCTAISIADASTWWLINSGSSLYHRASYAVSHMGSGAAKPSDDTEDLLPGGVRPAIDKAMAANPALDANLSTFANDTSDCGSFLADMINDRSFLSEMTDAPDKMFSVGTKLKGCQDAGYAYHASLVGVLNPFKDIYGPNEVGKWKRLLAATTMPGSWTPTKDFTSCDDTLKTLATKGVSSGADAFGQVHHAADCISHGSSIPTTTDQD